jgi:FdhD protein
MTCGSDSDRVTSGCQVVRWKPGQLALEARDQLAVEEPLEIRVGGRSVAVTMRTPGHDKELAAGFLLSEGIVRSPSDITAIAHCQQGEAAQHGNVLNVFLAPGVTFDAAQLTRHVFASSSCGLCGKASIESIHHHFPPVPATVRMAAERVWQMPDQLRSAQSAFERTGGLHAAGLFSACGQLKLAREDVGRHNAVDKVVGRCLLDGRWPLDSSILLVSGRASFEIMQKALAARIQIVAAVSAPSSLAVELALESGQTLIGFLRDQGMNIYSHPERVLG